MTGDLFGKAIIDHPIAKEIEKKKNETLRNLVDNVVMSQPTPPRPRRKDVCGGCDHSGWTHGTVLRECRHPVVGGPLDYDGKETCNFRTKKED